MLYPQNGDRIVTVDSVTSLHLMYKNMLIDWLKPIEMSFGVWSLGDPRNRELGPIRGARIPHGRGNFCGQWPQWLARSRYVQPHSLGGDSGAAFSYQSTVLFCSVLFCSLAVLDPRVGYTMDVLSPFIPVLCHSDWPFHGESCPRLDVVHPGRVWPSSPSCIWHCSLHYLFLQATPLFPHGVTIVC